MRRFWLGLLLAMIVGAGYAWLYGPEWLESWNETNQQVVEQHKREGAEVGQQTDQQGCFTTALQRVESCKESEFRCTVNSGTFLKACFNESQPTEGFCDQVPAYNESATADDKAWVKDQCMALGVQAKGCRLLMRQQQQICSQ